MEQHATFQEEALAPPVLWLGIRKSAIIETLIFLVVATLIDMLFGSGSRFVNLNPHPFWIIVLIITVQYGTKEGVMAALFSTLFLYLGNVPDMSFKENLFEFRVRLALLPVLWITAAVVLGEIRMRQEYDKRRLNKRLNLAEEEVDTIGKAYEDLKERKERLEVKLATQVHSLGSAYSALRGLESQSPGAILYSLKDLVAETVRPEKFSIYAFQNGQFEAAVHEGWSKEDSYMRRFSLSHPLAAEILARKGVVSIISREDEKILAGEGLVAVPIIDAASGDIYGMLKIEEMPLHELNLSSLEILTSICEIIGTTFSNTKLFQEAKKRSIYVGKYEGIFSLAELNIVHTLLKKVASRSKSKFYEMHIHFKPSHYSEKSARILARLILDCSTEEMMLFMRDDKKPDYIALDASASKEEFEEFKKRIEYSIQSDFEDKEATVEIEIREVESQS